MIQSVTTQNVFSRTQAPTDDNYASDVGNMQALETNIQWSIDQAKSSTNPKEKKTYQEQLAQYRVELDHMELAMSNAEYYSPQIQKQVGIIHQQFHDLFAAINNIGKSPIISPRMAIDKI